MTPISKDRFEALVAYTRSPNATGAHSIELEWYADSKEILLATIIVDFDNEFTAIILGRDANRKFHCINFPVMFKSIDDARYYMYEESKRLNPIMPASQDNNKKSKNKDIFNPVYRKNRLNPRFESIRTLNEYSSAREIIAEIMPHYRDVDGNFIEQFQTTGFDSRIWELYLFAYLTEERFFIERNEAPDFMVSDGINRVAIEAVTVNPTQSGDIDLNASTPQEIKELLLDYMPIKFGSPLFSKLHRNREGKKNYWEMEHVKGKPIVFAIADFHAEGSMTWSSTALSNYLYGLRHDFHVSDDNDLIIKPIPIDAHRHDDKKIPSGFFFSKDAEQVSAVLFSAAGTISKFVRMGKIAGFGESSIKVKYGGLCHNHSSLILPSRFFFEVDNKYNESWGAGISIFHNPNALHPIPEEMFPSVAHHHMLNDGKVVCLPPKFHPYSGFTLIHPSTDEITEDVFNSMFTTFSTVTGEVLNLS